MIGAATTAPSFSRVKPEPMPPAATALTSMSCLSAIMVSSMSVTDFGLVKATVSPSRSAGVRMSESGRVTQRISPVVCAPVWMILSSMP